MKGNKFVEILVLFLFFVCSVRAIDLDIENLAEKTSSPTTLSRRMDIILMPQDRSAPTNSHPPYLSPNIRRYDGPANGPPWENGFPFAPPPARLPPLRPPPSRSFESGVEEVAMHLEHLMSEISVFNNISGRYDAVMAQMRNMETELTNLNNDLSRMRRDMDDEFARRPPPPRGFPPIRGGNINYFNPPALPSRRRGRVLEEPKGFPEISCPSNYVRIKWRCYFFSLFVSQDWDTASDYCVRDKQTGHLAQFETIEEYQDMIKYISDHQELADESYWIGGRQQEQGNMKTFRWDKGRLKLAEYLENEILSNQLTDYADLDSHGIQCLMIHHRKISVRRRHDYRLQATRCHTFQRFICEL